MPRLSATSLGLKLNLSMLFFVLLLGSATASFILYGFQRTQDNATERSRESLEEIGRQQVQTIASDQADLGAFQLLWASDASQMAARYLVELKRNGGRVPFDATGLTRTPAGVLYDPDPNRTTDLVMPNFAPLNSAALQDIADTAAFDALFPVIMSTYPGQLRGQNFDAIAVTYSSVNQVTRYYPPIGLFNIAPPDTDISPTLNRLGALNPERRTVWSVPYQDNAGQGIVITANTPVYDGDTYLGVIGIDLSITRLVMTIDEVSPTQFGFAFYIDNNGKLLESDSFDSIQEELAQGNDQLRAGMQAMRRGEESVARINVSGREMFVGYSPIAGVGGSFAVVASVDELTAQAAAITASIEREGNRTLMITLLAMLGIFLVGLAGETWLNRRFILQPIEALVAGTRQVARGDLSTTIPVRSEDELGILATSFNTMTNEMRSRRDALQREVRERTEAQDELRALFAAMTDRVVVIHRDGRLLRIAQTGGPSLLAEDDRVGQMVQEIRPPNVAAITLNSVREALATQQTVTIEFPFETPDGEHWLSAAYSPLSSDSVVAVVRDITDFVGAQREVERQRDELKQEVKEREAAQDELRALFAAMTDTVVVIDKDGRYLRVPITNAPDYLVTPQNLPGKTMWEVMPNAQANGLVVPLRKAIESQQTQTIEYPLVVDGRTIWFSAAISPISTEAVVVVARDITQGVEDRLQLERQRDELQQEVRERKATQDELRALFAAMTDRVIVVDRDGNYIRVAETNAPERLRDQTTQPNVVRNPEAPDEVEIMQLAALRQAIDEQRPVTIEYPLLIEGNDLWMSATLSPMTNNTALVVARDITDRFNAQKELERRVEERTRELNTVLDVSHDLVATLDLNTLLQVIMEQTERVCQYSRASVYLYDQGYMALFASRVPGGKLTTMPPSFRLEVSLLGDVWREIVEAGPAIIDDVRSDTPSAVGLRTAVGSAFENATQGIHSWMGIPLLLKDRVVGLIALTHVERGYFTPHHYDLVQAIANQAAVAIENAKLYESAQQLAAIEERQKLARELHDSVSQALYGIALGARTARTQLDREPLKAIEPVDYVLQLAEAGLAEMRAFIFELRPESLEIEGLVAALEKQVAATSARYGIKVSGELDAEPGLSLTNKEVFYRIAQEALHNVVKHAHASEATIRLKNNGEVTLEVSDNGVGFDSSQSFPGHMGLVSMSERAANIGASIAVESRPGEGTTVRLILRQQP